MDGLVCRRDDLSDPRLALTFDDGPSAATPAILDMLGRHGAAATFFVNGWAVEARPEVTRRAAAEGHEVGNHTFDHIDVQGERDDDVVRDQLTRTSDLVEDVAGARPRLVRPPFGKDVCRTARIGRDVGLRPCVLWSTMVWDWDPATTAAWMVERALAEATPGSILLFHDGMPPGIETPREPTVAAVAELVPALLGRGFELVTVSELLALP
jgi:peptidoglycan/xylan/chitin deacetylase (PgdA/CDA1 family)